VDFLGPLAYQQYCDVIKMATDPRKAPLAHFHGPLKIEAQTIFWKLPPDLALKRGATPTDLRAFIGTMDPDKGCWAVVRTHDDKNHSALGEGVHPFVDMEFPAKKKSDPPIKRRYALDQFC